MSRLISTTCAVPIAMAAALLLGLAVPRSALAQQVYTWKDKAGTTHYSESPPPGGQKARQLALDVDTAHDAPPPVAAEPSAKLEDAERQYRLRACKAARGDLKLLAGDAMVVAGGSVTAATKLDAQQKQEARKRANARVKQFCDAKQGER